MYKYEIVTGQVCGTCLHYRQHFVYRDGTYFPLWYGHCPCPRRKTRTPDQTCDFWEAHNEKTRPPDDSGGRSGCR